MGCVTDVVGWVASIVGWVTSVVGWVEGGVVGGVAIVGSVYKMYAKLLNKKWYHKQIFQ